MNDAALIMAGGRSERMRAGGSPLHKGLRSVRGAPLIELNLRTLLSSGFRRLFVAVSVAEVELTAWASTAGQAMAQAVGGTLSLLCEERPLGTIGAAGCLPKELSAVLVVNVDNLSTLNLRELWRFHQREGAAATIATHVHPFRIPFGLLELQANRVRGYREKPEVPLPISSGTYVLGRRALDAIEPAERIDVPALTERLLAEGESIAAFPHQETWVDVNDERALAHAETLFAEHGPLEGGTR